MERNDETKGIVHPADGRTPEEARTASQECGTEHDVSGSVVDTEHGTGRDHPHSVYSKRTTEKEHADKMIGIAVYGFALLPKQGDRSRRDRRHYTDKKVKANAGALAMLLRGHAPSEPWTGPVACELVFGFPFHNRESAFARDAGWAWADTKPDVDNLTKQALDTLQACGFFVNDSQVAQLVVTKLRMEYPVLRIQLFRLSPLSRRDPWFLLRCPT